MVHELDLNVVCTSGYEQETVPSMMVIMSAAPAVRFGLSFGEKRYGTES